jgi:hypothetical protein
MLYLLHKVHNALHDADNSMNLGGQPFEMGMIIACVRKESPFTHFCICSCNGLGHAFLHVHASL